jgi:hypothetical protein
MPLLPVYYTTTNLRKRKQRKHDNTEHVAWLTSMGLTTKQIKAKKTKDAKWRAEYSVSLQVERSTKEHERSLREVCNGGPNATANRSVMANIHKESEATRKAILDKAARTAPLYSKGPYQLITDGASLSEIGKKM